MIEQWEEADNSREDLIQDRNNVDWYSPPSQRPWRRRQRFAIGSPPQNAADADCVRHSDGAGHQTNDAVEGFRAAEIEEGEADANKQGGDLIEKSGVSS